MSPSSDNDRDTQQRYGYSRRRTQSPDYLAVPAAMLEEVRDSIGSGDARSAVERLLDRSEVLVPEHMEGDDGVGSYPPQPTDHAATRYRRLVGGWRIG